MLYAIVATGTGQPYSHEIQEVPLLRAMMTLERDVLDGTPLSIELHFPSCGIPVPILITPFIRRGFREAIAR